MIWGLWCQKKISDRIPQNTVGCDYLSLPEIPASDTKVLISSVPEAGMKQVIYPVDILLLLLFPELKGKCTARDIFEDTEFWC